MKDALLTHGNIRKSHHLKYCVSELPVRELLAETEAYQKYFSGLQFPGLKDVFPYLHDADIRFSASGGFLTINFRTDYFEDEIGILTGTFRFEDAKLFGFQCLRKTGHIARFNHPVKNLTFGYEEFYESCGFFYVTLLVYDKKWPPYKTGYQGLLTTIRFRNMVVESNLQHVR